jgi:hypothetical protein
VRAQVLGMLCGLLAMPTTAMAQRVPNTRPRFESYPVQSPATGRNRLILGRADIEYRTQLRIAARQPPNFAGHYVVALWGCGMECAMGAAIDVRSGHVTWLPGTVCCWLSGPDATAPDAEPVRYRRDSRLLILTGLRNEHEGDWGEHYYTIDGKRVVKLLDVPRQG